MSPLVERLVFVGYRLGLGWLVGRRIAVLTTTAADKETEHAAVPIQWRGGEILVPVPNAAASWVANLEARPVAMVQAAPGPLSSVAERRNGVVAFRPTGQPAPFPIDTDLIWVIPALLLAVVLAKIVR